MSLKPAHPASRTLFAKAVLANFDGLTSPTTINPYPFAILASSLCRKSFRRLAALAWIAQIFFGVFLARWALANANSFFR
jgi:hypothetical protein